MYALLCDLCRRVTSVKKLNADGDLVCKVCQRGGTKAAANG